MTEKEEVLVALSTLVALGSDPDAVQLIHLLSDGRNVVAPLTSTEARMIAKNMLEAADKLDARMKHVDDRPN